MTSLKSFLTLISLEPNQKDTVMSAAQQLEERGKEEGMQLGREEEKLGIARSMLHNLNLGMDVIHQATGLSKEAISRL